MVMLFETKRPVSESSGGFEVSAMPAEAIRRRVLHQFSVHRSSSTGKWIATIMRPAEPQRGERRQCTQVSFKTEREARKFARAYSPPRMMQETQDCCICSTKFDSRSRPYNCRNCGVCMCDKCSTRWGIRMVPKTYIRNPPASVTVRVCKSCDWLSNAFCMALLQGKYEDALALYETGNVNIRTCFADIHREAMFPVHCAVMGGNVQVLKWLVDVHLCPLSAKRDPKTGKMLSVQTSANRTLVDLAMTGKPKVEILKFLVQKNISIMDARDANLAPKTLETLLRAGYAFDEEACPPLHVSPEPEIHVIPGSEESVTTIVEDACILCCEKSMDCVLTPCGHQVCCAECGTQLQTCPVCKVECVVLRVFRM